jgi:hypothetical protein
MEFWEGAVLVVGGVALVWYMTNRSKQMAQQVSVGAASPASSAGVSNSSNLTTITNQQASPPVWGEPLEPPAAPVSGAIPVKPILVSPTPFHTPIVKPTIPISQLRRPMDMHIL